MPCQELDDEYLIVWQGFEGKPWDYTTEVQQLVCLTGLCRKSAAVVAGRPPGLPHQEGCLDQDKLNLDLGV